MPQLLLKTSWALAGVNCFFPNLRLPMSVSHHPDLHRKPGRQLVIFHRLGLMNSLSYLQETDHPALKAFIRFTFWSMGSVLLMGTIARGKWPLHCLGIRVQCICSSQWYLKSQSSSIIPLTLSERDKYVGNSYLWKLQMPNEFHSTPTLCLTLMPGERGLVTWSCLAVAI